MSNKSLFALIGGVLLAIVAWNSIYIVYQTEKAVLLQFGKIQNPDVKPGLHFKVPLMNQVRKFDGRLLTLESPIQRILTKEKKAVMVDAYAKWRVADAEHFYTATSGIRQIADDRLSQRLITALANQFARGGLEATEARGWMLALLAASLIAKSVIAWVSGGTAYGWRVSAGLMAALAAGAAMVVVF